MNDLMIKSVEQKAKNWWMSLIIGLLALAVGILSSMEPFLTVSILTLFFVANFLISGIFEIIFAIASRDNLKAWGWTLAGGIVNFIFAVILIMMPIASVMIFMYYIAFYILLQAIIGIWSSYTMKGLGYNNWWMFLTIAMLGVILGVILILQPQIAAGFISIIFAAALICFGLFRIFYAFRLKKLRNIFDK